MHQEAKMIPTAPRPENWKRPAQHPRITWLNTVQTRSESLQPHTEWSSRPGSQPPSVEADTYVWRYALLVVHARKKRRKQVCINVDSAMDCSMFDGFIILDQCICFYCNCTMQCQCNDVTATVQDTIISHCILLCQQLILIQL